MIFEGAEVATMVLAPKIAGRREARKEANRDWVVGKGGSGDGEV